MQGYRCGNSLYFPLCASENKVYSHKTNEGSLLANKSFVIIIFFTVYYYQMIFLNLKIVIKLKVQFLSYVPSKEQNSHEVAFKANA